MLRIGRPQGGCPPGAATPRRRGFALFEARSPLGGSASAKLHARCAKDRTTSAAATGQCVGRRSATTATPTPCATAREQCEARNEATSVDAAPCTGSGVRDGPASPSASNPGDRTATAASAREKRILHRRHRSEAVALLVFRGRRRRGEACCGEHRPGSQDATNRTSEVLSSHVLSSSEGARFRADGSTLPTPRPPRMAGGDRSRNPAIRRSLQIPNTGGAGPASSITEDTRRR